jgi:hypothetical protein
MKIQNILFTLTGVALGCCLAGCGPDFPFEAEYTSRNQVIITYQGKRYTLDRYGIPAQTPFSYRFEQDGDLDLKIDGRLYEVDSPYDRDKKKVKKKTVRNKAGKKQHTAGSEKPKR